MAEVWFLVRADMHKHEKMAALPNDTARLGWYVVLAEARLQRHRAFASRAHFRYVLGRYGSYLEAYLQAGLLIENPDGSLAPCGMKRRERQLRRAERRRAFLLVVSVGSNSCGVCGDLLTSKPFPHPRSTTIGHEPPISRAFEDGWRVIAERPEHWGCNREKASLYDMELHRG